MEKKKIAEDEELKDVKKVKKGRKGRSQAMVKYGTPPEEVDEEAQKGTGNER